MCNSSPVLSGLQICAIINFDFRGRKIGGRNWFEVSKKTCNSVWSFATRIERLTIKLQFEFDCKTSNQRGKVTARKHRRYIKGQETINGKLSAPNHNKYNQTCTPRSGSTLCKLCDRPEIRLNRFAAYSCFRICYGRWHFHRTWTNVESSLGTKESAKHPNHLWMRQNIQSFRVSLTFKIRVTTIMRLIISLICS